MTVPTATVRLNAISKPTMAIPTTKAMVSIAGSVLYHAEEHCRHEELPKDRLRPG